MVISTKNCTPACNIVMNGTVLKQVHIFNYLGSLITSDGRCINEIKRRMAQAKASFHNMKSILTNKRMSLGVRKRVLQCYIEPILLYGCESWSMEMWLLRRMENTVNTFQRRHLRKILGIHWPKKITNIELYTKTEEWSGHYTKTTPQLARPSHETTSRDTSQTGTR